LSELINSRGSLDTESTQQTYLLAYHFWKPLSKNSAHAGNPRKMAEPDSSLRASTTASLSKTLCITMRLPLKRKEKTTPFGVNLKRSQVLYRAAQKQSISQSVCHSINQSTNPSINQSVNADLYLVLGLSSAQCACTGSIQQPRLHALFTCYMYPHATCITPCARNNRAILPQTDRQTSITSAVSLLLLVDLVVCAMQLLDKGHQA